MTPERVRAANAYIGVTVLATVLTLIGASGAPHDLDWAWWGVVVLLAATTLAESWAIPLPKAGLVSVSTMLHIVAALLLPPVLAALVAGMAMFICQMYERAPLRRLIFNTCCATTTVGVTAILASHLGLLDGGLGSGGPSEILKFFVLATVNYLINDLLVTGIGAVSSGEPFWRLLVENSRHSAPAEVSVTVIGGLLALVWVRAPFWLPAALFPALISQLTLKYIDASARRAAELRHQMMFDALTDLPNRTLLQDRLRDVLAAGDGGRRRAALLMIDLDRFKDVNDTFGHAFGDRLLIALGTRLRAVLREGDMLARLGGDEFGVLLPEADAEESIAIAERLTEALRAAVILDEYSLHVAASIGIALIPEHGEDAETVLRRADVAMYVAKGRGDGYALYSSAQDGHSPERLALLGDLRAAIEIGELRLHYQPKVEFATGQVVGVEALVRWLHPQRGLVPPVEFIGLAEQTGLIRPLGEWVLGEALRQQHEWRAGGIDLPVSVNLSAQNLNEPLPDAIAELLARWQIPGDRLRIEITESTLVADPDKALLILLRLRDMGVHIAIDDFGTGYSSLSYLKRLPVDEIKIDRSFVCDMATDADDTAIVRSTITLGHDLGMSVVAEGMEDGHTWDILADLGCDVAQGYFVAKPMPPQQLVNWMASPRRALRASVRAA